MKRVIVSLTHGLGHGKAEAAAQRIADFLGLDVKDVLILDGMDVQIVDAAEKPVSHEKPAVTHEPPKTTHGRSNKGSSDS